MRLTKLPSSLLLYVVPLLLLWTAPSSCAESTDTDTDFSAYPSTTRICLSSANDKSGCEADTVTETNSCLCSNGGNFVTMAAQCIGDQGQDTLQEVYETMEDSCADTKTPLSVSEADFLAAGNETMRFITVTSTLTIVTTSAGVPMTLTTTSLSTSSSSIAATATSTNALSDDDDDEDDDDDDDDNDDEGSITVSAKVGAISASVAGVLMVACVVCLVVLLRKRKKDKALLQQVRDEARGHPHSHSHHGSGGGGDKPLLSPSAMTPGLPPSPTAAGLRGGDGGHVVFGASITPPTPSYHSRGPTSAPQQQQQQQAWRTNNLQTSSQLLQQQQNLGNGRAGGPTATTFSPSELSSEQWTYELYDSSHHNSQQQQSPYHLSPSPVSQGFGTMGSWCPSPVEAMGPYEVQGGGGGAAAAAASYGYGGYGGSSATLTGTMRSDTGLTTETSITTTGTIGALSTLSRQPSSPSSPGVAARGARQITGATVRSSWAHNRPVQDEPYELPGTEVRSSSNSSSQVPVEADSHPITRVPERLSMSISQAPPQYEPGNWIDPNTDKPPLGMI